MSAQPKFSPEELLEMENASPIRHEYIGGRLYAMAGGSPDHAAISANLAGAIASRLRGKPCRPSSSDQRVRVTEKSQNWYYPDFLIKCPPFRFHPFDKTALLNPRAIFEVLSPATQEFDRTKKFDEYKQISELTDYILVSTDAVRVEHFRRLDGSEWVQRVYTRREDVLRLENFGVEAPLEEIYDGIALEAQVVLPFDSEFLSPNG